MSEQKMFKVGEPRYLTRGIDDRLPVVYQIILWDTIDALRDTGFELDYLQVFVIKTKQNTERNGKVLEITHSQEVPEYSKTYEIPIKNEDVSIDGKIFVIDDVTHATMLWAEEY